MSFDRLLQAIAQKQASVVVGLDPMLSYVPQGMRQQAFSQQGETFEAASQAILEFNKGIIDAVHDLVPAVKPQYAYYEQYGWQGMRALQETIAYAKAHGLFVIADGKRNDIGSTMEAYAAAHLGKTALESKSEAAFDADALTVNGYLGTDGIAPLLQACKEQDKGIFVLCKTSNPSSGELQDLLLGDMPVYAKMGELCERWGEEACGQYGYSAVGAVVGATYPAQLRELRGSMPRTMFLIPGYGAQGGKPEDIALAFDQNGCGAIVNSSRAILCAYQKGGYTPQQYQEAARAETQHMIAQLQAYIPKIKL